MDRLTIAPRPDWRSRVESLGLVWHTADGAPYWNESACYRFSPADIAAIEQATHDLYRMYLAAGQYVVDRRLFPLFGIPAWVEPLIVEAWNAEPPALNYGRLDLGFDGRGPPKLFEFNCDTPTSLLEAAVVQWEWKQAVFPAADQFNSLHEALTEKWRDIGPLLAKGAPVHFSHQSDGSGEDAVTCAYLMDTAREAGLATRQLLMSDIGWDGARFVDLDRREIRTLYHLYPWEWLVSEPFSRHLLETEGRTRFIEPIWKMIWSNKAILPILWELHPGHPNLLWAQRDAPAGGSFVRKPILGREGANIQLVRDGREIAATAGVYGAQAQVYQELFELPEFDAARPVVGSWIVDGAPAGIGVREDGPITGNLARFVPHIVGR
jgi:glutathionylspermidine synthase